MLWLFVFGIWCLIGGVHNLALPLPTSGQPLNRRDDYTYTPGIGGYKLHTRAVIWNEARITCEEEGGHLAVINSIAELNAVTEVFKNAEAITGSPHPDYVSIGFHDLYSEGQFVTIHGQTLAAAGCTLWANGQPSGGGEHCGSLHKSGRLNDIHCGTKFGFVCEIPILQGDYKVQNVSLYPSPSGPLCAHPVHRRYDYAYTLGIGAHKVHTEAASWTRAWQICRNEGAHLAVINSYAESKLIGELLKAAGPSRGGNDPSHAHIGFHDLYVKDDWVTIDGQSLIEAGFAEWDNNEPNKLRNGERCGSVHLNGKLNDNDCDIKICRFICEMPYVEPLDAPIPLTPN